MVCRKILWMSLCKTYNSFVNACTLRNQALAKILINALMRSRVPAPLKMTWDCLMTIVELVKLSWTRKWKLYSLSRVNLILRRV